MLPSAIFLALTGTILLFDASPGINWGLWVTLLGVGLLGVQWMERARVGRTTTGLVVLACAFAWGAAVTGNEGVLALDLLATFTALSLAVLSLPDAKGADLTIPRLLLGPVEAPIRGIGESGRRLQEVVVRARRKESLPVIRGIALAAPVVVVFGLALSGADPVFAAWREHTFSFLDNAPAGEVAFGVVLFLGSLGALGVAARGGSAVPQVVEAVGRPVVRLGTTERLIVLGAIAALFGCFLALQVSYLFGSAPAQPGSGVTFAEYARRGFFELTFVSAAAGALLVLMRGGDGRPGDARVIQLLELSVVGEVMLLLVSAFRKMLLYEAAYGYTVSRLWVHGVMIALALSLGALALELRGTFDVHRLARRTLATGAALLLVFTYWNHESWIATKNFERFQRDGRYDTAYVAQDLSMNAVPAALAVARELGGRQGACMEAMIRDRWAGQVSSRRWYEFNASERRARRALGTLAPLTTAPKATTGKPLVCDDEKGSTRHAPQTASPAPAPPA